MAPTPLSDWRTTLLVAVLVLAGVAHARPLRAVPPPHPWPAPETLGVEDRHPGLTDLVDGLLSTDDAEHAEAAVRLLDRAPALLPLLEARAAQPLGPHVHARLQAFLGAVTQRRLALEQLHGYRALWAIASRSIEEGQAAVAPWLRNGRPGALAVHESWELCGAEGPPPVVVALEAAREQELRRTLLRLGGLARPALEALLQARPPASRLLGLVLSESLRLQPGARVREALAQDAAEVALAVRRWGPGGGRPESLPGRPARVRIDEHAAQVLGALAERVREEEGPLELTFDVEARLRDWLASAGGSDEEGRQLGNALRFAGGWRAPDEDAYWNRGRGTWRAYWQGGGPGAREQGLTDRILQSRSGYQFREVPRRDGRRVVQLLGPVGARVELRMANGRRVRGVIPLELSRELRDAQEFEVVLVHPDGPPESLGTWRVPEAGTTWRMWLDPALLRLWRERQAAGGTAPR